MNKKISVGMAISLTAIVATIAIMLTYSVALNKFEARMSSITDREATYDLINEVDNKIRQKYYGEVSEDSLRYSIASGLIDGLGDDNCRYFTAEEWELEQDRKAGYDFGLGMDVTRTGEGEMRVTRVQSGSPAFKGGIKVGDIVARVDKDAVSDIGYEKARNNISAAQSEISLSIERDGQMLENAILLTKERFTIASVEYRIIEDMIGQITIYDFNGLTPEQFNTALGNLQKDNIRALVIDLRDNSGGSYAAAAEILDTLVGSGRLMIITDRDGEQEVAYMSDNRSVNLIYAVLVGEHTKGAAEVFASAMYDFTGCDVVGDNTAGQRRVIEDFTLSDGSAIRLSTGVWSTPKGALLEEGDVVTPNFTVKLTAYQKENMRLLSDSEEPQMLTALSRIRSKLEEFDDEAPISSSTDAVSASDSEQNAEPDGESESSDKASDDSTQE